MRKHPKTGENVLVVKEGTRFETPAGVVVLLSDAAIKVDGKELTRQSAIGFLQVTGNYELNREQFPFLRDPQGRVLPIDEQLEDGQTREDFIRELSQEDAEEFGVTEEWRGYDEVKVRDDEDRSGKAKSAAAGDDQTDAGKTADDVDKSGAGATGKNSQKASGKQSAAKESATKPPA